MNLALILSGGVLGIGALSAWLNTTKNRYAFQEAHDDISIVNTHLRGYMSLFAGGDAVLDSISSDFLAPGFSPRSICGKRYYYKLRTPDGPISTSAAQPSFLSSYLMTPCPRLSNTCRWRIIPKLTAACEPAADGSGDVLSGFTVEVNARTLGKAGQADLAEQTDRWFMGIGTIRDLVKKNPRRVSGNVYNFIKAAKEYDDAMHPTPSVTSGVGAGSSTTITTKYPSPGKGSSGTVQQILTAKPPCPKSHQRVGSMCMKRSCVVR